MSSEYLLGQAVTLGREVLLLGLESEELLLEVPRRGSRTVLPGCGFLDAELEVLDLDLAFAKVVLRLGLRPLGGAERGARRFPCLDRLRPGGLLRLGLTGEFELLFASGRELVVRFPGCPGRGLELAGVLVRGLGEVGQTFGEFGFLRPERGFLGLVRPNGLGELVRLGRGGLEGFPEMAKALVEPGVGHLLLVDLILELDGGRASRLGDLLVDRVDRRCELCLAGRELGTRCLQPFDLRADRVYLFSAGGEFLLGQAVAGPREASLRPLLVVLELLILDGEKPLTFESREPGLDVPHQGLNPVEVRIEVGTLRGRPLELVVELADPGQALDQAPPGDRPHRDDLVDVPLLDQIVAVAREAGVREQRIDLGLGRSLSVDVEVRVVPVGVARGELHVPRDLDLGCLDGEKLVGVVEDERDLAFRGGLLRRTPVEEEVSQPFGAQRLRTGGTENEEDRIRDVRLAHPVRTRDPGEPGLERYLGRAGERLEVPQFEPFQVHRVLPPIPRPVAIVAETCPFVGRLSAALSEPCQPYLTVGL